MIKRPGAPFRTLVPVTLAALGIAAGCSGQSAAPGGSAGSGGSAGNSASAAGHGGMGASGGASANGGAGANGGTSGKAGGSALAGGAGMSEGGASDAGAGGQDATAGAGGEAGSPNAPDPRWLDPGVGIGCGTTSTSECSGSLSWQCNAPPTNPAIQVLRPNTYCTTATCMRDWPDDDAFCPGPQILVSCVPDSTLPDRCTRYGTSLTMVCCDP